MFTIAFDTTANCCSIVVLKDRTVIAEFAKEMDFGQAETLLPQMEIMLKDQNLTLKNMDLLAVCVGPGSFTGVRSSVATARAIALALPNLAVTGISAFEAYANSLDMSELTNYNAVIIETKRDDFYFQMFNGKMEKITEPSALPYNEIITQLRGKNITLIGDGVERFLDKPSGLDLHTIRMDKEVSIKDVALCAIKKYNEKSLNYPKPLYLRAPDVCVKS